MLARLFHQGERPPPSGVTAGNLEPSSVWAWVDVLLAQAETLERLRRTEDRRRKLLWAMAITADCVDANPASQLAILNVARVARVGRQFDLAVRALSAAREIAPGERTDFGILYQENLLVRERDIAGGSHEAMASRLIVYACHQCGRLIEYISVPCIYCGWRPTTLLATSQSSRLSTTWFTLWELFGIGRQIHAGRKATEVVVNIADVAANLVADPESWYRPYVQDIMDTAEKKSADDFFCYSESSKCHNCGSDVARQDASQCGNCRATIRAPPPLRLLKCLTRLSIHFQHNFESPRSKEYDLFIRFLISLQSKLFRMQETPSDRERAQVLTLMIKLEKFEVANGAGTIAIGNPKNVSYEMKDALAEDKKVIANTVLADFADAFQFLANWMSRTKSLS